MTHSVDSPCQSRLETEGRLGKPEHSVKEKPGLRRSPSDSACTSKKRNLGHLPVYVDLLMSPSEDPGPLGKSPRVLAVL